MQSNFYTYTIFGSNHLRKGHKILLTSREDLSKADLCDRLRVTIFFKSKSINEQLTEFERWYITELIVDYPNNIILRERFGRYDEKLEKFRQKWPKVIEVILFSKSHNLKNFRLAVQLFCPTLLRTNIYQYQLIMKHTWFGRLEISNDFLALTPTAMTQSLYFAHSGF